MGNLGRAGFGGSTDGLWPYTYDSCDHGTLPNQTDQNGIPALTRTDGSEWHNGSLSYLPGQRLSRCTCKSDKHHPGPKHSDGSWVGRGAPEIDMIEALVNDKRPTETAGEVSLSGQWAPFNPHYEYINDTTKYDDTAIYNTYFGAVYQQATSVLGTTDPNCYTNVTGCFSRYGFEYANGDDGYITWLSNNKKTWTIRQTAMGPNEDAMVGQRLISMEPMYIILNLGLSDQFVTPK
jgi:beta-glucanase (GH16 family)